MPDDTNSEDPCERAAALRKTLTEIATGGRVFTYSYSANGVSRSATNGAPNIALLRSLLEQAEQQCALQTGATRPGRFAIEGGSRRVWGEGDTDL